MFNRQSPTANPQSDDDLISAYLDGRLTASERAHFEARLQSDPTLRRQVEVTRLLIRTARTAPEPRLPRTFTLPVSSSVRPAVLWRESNLLLRVGSALATAVFVIALGLELSGLSQPPAQTMPATAADRAASVVTAPAQTESDAQSTSMQEAQPASEPNLRRQPMSAAESAPATAASDAPRPLLAPQAASEASQAPQATPVPQTARSATPLPAALPTATVESSSPGLDVSTEEADSATAAAGELPWWRIVGGVALAVAVLLGILSRQRA
ncbi:MAG: hypothetical protein RMN25_09585 [Anaerolineae bacterium]|nr:hypothetical protein [Thermoflexales bacterium]MDW8408021.1 hypothetical protein [Anaerolineae bacterium]